MLFLLLLCLARLVVLRVQLNTISISQTNKAQQVSSEYGKLWEKVRFDLHNKPWCEQCMQITLLAFL